MSVNSNFVNPYSFDINNQNNIGAVGQYADYAIAKGEMGYDALKSTFWQDKLDLLEGEDDPNQLDLSFMAENNRKLAELYGDANSVVKRNALKGMKSGAAAGAAVGTAVAGPLGTLVGGVGGAIQGTLFGVGTGLLSKRGRMKEFDRANRENQRNVVDYLSRYNSNVISDAYNKYELRRRVAAENRYPSYNTIY